VLKFSLSLTPCVASSYLSKCMEAKEIMKEYELPVTIEVEDPEECRPTTPGTVASRAWNNCLYF
jgi:hypothetical protein